MPAGECAIRELISPPEGVLEREEFYARARTAFVVVRTAELRPYGNILLVKGVVNRYPMRDDWEN